MRVAWQGHAPRLTSPAGARTPPTPRAHTAHRPGNGLGDPWEQPGRARTAEGPSPALKGPGRGPRDLRWLEADLAHQLADLGVGEAAQPARLLVAQRDRA